MTLHTPIESPLPETISSQRELPNLPNIFNTAPFLITPVEGTKRFFDKNGILSVSYFNFLLKQTEKTFIEYVFTVNSLSDMRHAISQMNNDLPTKAVFKSVIYDRQTIKNMYNSTLSQLNVSEIMNMNTLANYNEARYIKTRFVLFDKPHKEYNSRQILKALESFSRELAGVVHSDNVEQTIITLYNYIFDNFKYNASSYLNMLVGNLGNGEMACNGISRLTFETLNRLGIQSEIRQGYSHFWNVVLIGDSEITFDVTSDILINKRFLTLGNGSKEHVFNTLKYINIYNAAYDHKSYMPVAPYKFSSQQLMGKKSLAK